jgi:hypothetical protein
MFCLGVIGRAWPVVAKCAAAAATAAAAAAAAAAALVLQDKTASPQRLKSSTFRILLHIRHHPFISVR